METARARFFAFSFWVHNRKFLNQPVRFWMREIQWLLVIVALLARMWVIAAVLIVAIAILAIAFRRAKRQGYATFRTISHPPSLENLPLLVKEKRIPIRATGQFSAGRNEHHVILRKGEIWHVPVDQHMIMVEGAPGRFLYQFVEPKYTESIELGEFLFGEHTLKALKITFQTDWSPKIDHSRIAYFVGGGLDSIGRLKRTVFIAFESEADQLLLWKSFHRVID